MENLFPIFKSALTIMVPLLFAAAGGLFPALAGTLNIALEGLLLAGAFSSLAVFHHTGSITLSIMAAIIAAMILSLLHAFTSFKLKANLFITGLAINLLSSGLCIVLSNAFFNTRGVVVSRHINGLLNRYLVIALLLLLVSTVIIYKTPFGFRLRACEKNSDALISLGIKPEFYQTTALIISALFCALGGAFLSLNLGAFVHGMSAGKGWIALVIIFLGARKPHGILAAAFIYALAESLSNYAQGRLTLPADFLLAFPYFIALLAMIIVSIVPKKI
jgi:simple sugar transport system permease protein